MTTPHMIDNPELDAKLSDIDAFIDCFDDELTGFAALFAGLSVEQAKAAGAA